MASMSPTLPKAKPPRALACVLCRRRKVKCDHNFPCANCVSLNRPCVPANPAPPGARKKIKAELHSKLLHFEALLRQFEDTSMDESMQTAETNASHQGQVHRDIHPDRASVGYLIEQDKSTTYTTRTLWAMVHEELQSMQNLVAESTSDPGYEQPLCLTPPDVFEPSSIDGSSVTPCIENLLPSPEQMWDLWQIFLARVHPLTKVVHGPTLQQSVDESIRNPCILPWDIQALMFSIYSISVNSLTESECQQMLQLSKGSALEQFCEGLRMALLQAQFLTFPTLPSLQALTLYLISLQGRYNSDSNWILNGVCIRIALKLGLHQDGELLGLSPFESEIRRRIWWQIMLLDVRFARASGLGLTLLPRASHCKMPVNLNDADLNPAATEPFQDKNGPTEMIICLLFYKLGQLLLDGQGCQDFVTYGEMIATGSETGSEGQLRQIHDLAERIRIGLDNIMERFSDPSAGPLHELATHVKRVINERTGLFNWSPCEQPEWGFEILTPSDNLFKLSIVAIEQYVRYREALSSKGFLWSTLTSFHHDVFLYMVVQLCLRTSGSLVERAWVQIPIIYSRNEDLFDYGESTSLVMAKYVLKAWKTRRNVLRLRLGCAIDDPDYIQKLERAMLQHQIMQTTRRNHTIPVHTKNWFMG